MAFDQSQNFVYTGQTEYWRKDINVSSALFIVKGAGGGGGNLNSTMGGGGAYVFAKYDYLNPDISYNVSINIGSGGKPPPLKTGGNSTGSIDIIGIGNQSNAGDGSKVNNLESGGGGGLTSANYIDVDGNTIIKTIAGGGGGAGSISGANGGDGDKIGFTGAGTGGGEGGNTDSNGNPGLGGENGGSNGYKYIDSSYNGVYTYLGGGGGNGGSFAGGGGGAGYGGGAGGNKGGGGGGGSYALLSSRNLFVAGAGGAGGTQGNAGTNGSIQVLWNVRTIFLPPFVRMFMLNSQHTSKSIYTAPSTQPSLAYPAYLTDSLTFPYSAIIGTDKEHYIISGEGVLYAFDHIFEYRWKYSAPTNYKFTGTPAISNNGTLYIVSITTTNQNYLFAIIDINIGNSILAVIKWKFEIDGKSAVSPIMDLSGNIYVGTDNGSLYAINDDASKGTLLWKYSSPSSHPINGVPVFNIAYNKMCYTTKNTTIPTSSSIYVIDISNNNLTNPPVQKFTKTINTNNEYYQTPSIDNNNHVYVPTTTNNIYAYDISNNVGATLNELWNLSIADSDVSSIAINDESNQLIFTSQRKLNIADSSTGILGWEYEVDTLSSPVSNNSIPIIDSNNNIYFGSRDTQLYSINAITHNFNWKYKTDGAIQGMPVIDSTGSIIMGSNDSKIYKFDGNGAIVPISSPIVPMYMINPQHTGISPYIGPFDLPTTLWSTDFVSGNLFVSPSISIASNGTLYLGSNDGYIYALNPTNPTNNHVIWKKQLIDIAEYPITSQLYTTPAIALDGTIYIGSNEGYLYALNPVDGTIKWSYYAGHPLQSSPTIDNTSNTIYFGAGYSVYAIGDAGYKGYLKWLTPFDTSGNVYSSPALGLTGKLYFGSDDGYVYAVDSLTGLFAWKQSTNTTPVPPNLNPIFTSPAVDLSNNVIIGNGSFMNGVLYCYAGDTGDVLWNNSYDANIGPFYNTVAVYGDTIYLSTIAYVYAINRINGVEKYKFKNGNFYYTSPIIDANGTLYLASLSVYTSDGILHSITDNGATLIENWSYTVSYGRLAPPVIGDDGTIYISSTANKIYAIK
jgi:outer membrane protein assembly factor BamB